jgi:uncharacterized membrane protein YedE/YeeE
MRLKVWTTAFMVFGLLLLASWPFIVGKSPGEHATKREHLQFAVRYGLYIIALLLTFATSAIMAIATVGQARKQFREQTRKNFEELVEGTLQDHARKQG